jgi:autotransporter translocation and assembly factor TamB
MKTQWFIGLAVLFCILGTVAWAADVTGTWKAQVPARDGSTREMTINLKQDGSSLTGTIGGPQGDTPIANGKVSGDDISFTVVRSMGGNEVKINYNGKISGNEIKFVQTREGSERKTEFTAKKS